MKIAELMTREVVTVEPEATLRELASLLSDEHIGGVPVVRGEEVVGVVSAADLLTFDASSPGAPSERPVQTSGFGEEADTLEMEVEEGEEAAAAYFAGFWEDAGADVAERFATTDSPEWNVLDEHTVSEIMTEEAFALSPDTEVREAARTMLDADIHRALVMEDHRLLGMVTTLDILRAVAERGLAGPVVANRP